MAFTGPMEDRILIRELHGTYADASFSGDKQGWLDCWVDDCVWSTTFGESVGKQAMGDKWDQLWQSMTVLAFFTETGAIEVTGDSATARCYVREVFRMKGSGQTGLIARYDDELVREDGAWKYVKRSYSILQREGEDESEG